MLLPGLPPLVRDGDRFRATVTVRNASERKLAVNVTASTTPGVGTLATQPLDLAPGDAREVSWTATVPIGVTKLDWQIAASTRADDAAPTRDALKISQTVVAAVPERTYQATILQLVAPESITVQRPVDAIPGRGGVDVRLQAKLGGDLPGVREYFSFYPYSCLEQRASIAVGLGRGSQPSSDRPIGSISTRSSPRSIRWLLDGAPPMALFRTRQCHTPGATCSAAAATSGGSLM